ncbi:hypothetical protein LINGRAHAP2_LOCUS6790 [Linum grandiflorum]
MVRPNTREHPFLNSKVVKKLTCRQRCSPRRIVECIRVTSDDRKSLLKSIGLERFIDVQLTSIEIKVVSWIIQNYNYENHSITLLDGKVHKLVPNDVQLVYGLPRGSIDVPPLEDVTRDTTDSWAAELHLVLDKDYYTLNSIKNALDVVESDTDWVRLFFLYIFACLFCPPSNTTVDLRYLAFVSGEHMSNFKTYNWCKFVLEKFKENMAGSKDCSYMRADFYFLIVSVAFLLKESKLVGGESVLQSVTDKSVVDFFNSIIGDYCRLNIISPNADESDYGDENNKVEVKKKKQVSEVVKLRDLIKADVKRKQKGKVPVEKKHMSKADSKKKRMEKEVEVLKKKLVTKVNAKRKRTAGIANKEVKGEVGNRTKRKKVITSESSTGLGKNKVVLPSASIVWSDVKGIPEAVSLLDTMVQARNSCTNLIKDYDVAVSDLENFIKNLKDSEEGAKTVEEDGAEHDNENDAAVALVSLTGGNSSKLLLPKNSSFQPASSSFTVPSSEVSVLSPRPLTMIPATSYEELLEEAVVAYCLDESLDHDEILYKVTVGNDTVVLSRKDVMTFPDGKHLSVNALNVYGDFINRKHVKETGRSVKRWICKEYMAYSNLYHIFDAGIPQESHSLEMEDMLQYRWATRLDFSQVDYWFIPFQHDVNFVLFVIDNVHGTYDYLHSIPTPNLEQVYETTIEKAISFVEYFVEKFFHRRKVGKAYKWKEHKKVEQMEATSSGMYVLNWCQQWQGKYVGEMSSLWRKSEYIKSRRMNFITDLVLSDTNLMKSRLVERTLQSDTS